MPFDDWLTAGHQIAHVSSVSSWWLADWLLYGERAYGERYKAALELTALDYKTLRNYAWIARRFELSRRRDNLSFQHHAEVAGLPEPLQELWLKRAETQRWSRNEFRRQLVAARRGTSLGVAGNSIVLRMEIGVQRERRWREAADTANLKLSDWIATMADEAAEAALAARRRQHSTCQT